jgi:twitching motility protein PilT
VLNTGLARCIRERRFAMMPGLIQIGGRDGMHTIDDSLLHLLNQGFIAENHALLHCRDKDFISTNHRKHLIATGQLKPETGKKR